MLTLSYLQFISRWTFLDENKKKTNIVKSVYSSISTFLQHKWGQDCTNQFTIVLHINLKNAHHESEDAFHVLGECLLYVSASLGRQRLEGDHILSQPQKDQHDQLCLGLLWKQRGCFFSLICFYLALNGCNSSFKEVIRDKSAWIIKNASECSLFHKRCNDSFIKSDLITFKHPWKTWYKFDCLSLH